MEKELGEIKDLIHGLDKNISNQISGLDRRFAVLEISLQNITDKIVKLEKIVDNKAEKEELKIIKKELEELKIKFFEVKEETSKNSVTRTSVSKLSWILVTAVVGLIFYIMRIKTGA